jgi:hypothetical protein
MPRRVASGMKDATTRVRGLLREQQFAAFAIKLRPPLDQLAHVAASVFHQHAHGALVA